MARRGEEGARSLSLSLSLVVERPYQSCQEGGRVEFECLVLLEVGLFL
jgi:hypothetical protein